MTNGRWNHDVRREQKHEGLVADLMLGYCRGEREAFEGFYARVAPAIFAELLAWTGDRRRAEDLLDRTFQALHAHRSAYVEGADPLPWIGQLARREFLIEQRERASAGQRPFWSRVRTVFTRAAVELEAG